MDYMTWDRKLARPVAVDGGPTLRTLSDARAFVLALPDEVLRCSAWEHKAALLMEAAKNGRKQDIETVTIELELELVLKAKLGLS
jgi:hypothetical protein